MHRLKNIHGNSLVKIFPKSSISNNKKEKKRFLIFFVAESVSCRCRELLNLLHRKTERDRIPP